MGFDADVPNRNVRETLHREELGSSLKDLLGPCRLEFAPQEGGLGFAGLFNA